MRSVLNEIALILFGLLLGLLALEVMVRIWIPLPDQPPPFDRSAAFYLSEKQQSRPGRSAAMDPVRIAVIGDSFTKGVGVQTYDRYANRLEWLFNLNAGTRPVKIRVFDNPGTSTFQQIGLLEQALSWKAQLVILGVVLNDTEDHSRPREIQRHRSNIYPKPPPAWLAPWRTGSLLYNRWSAHSSRRRFAGYYRWLNDEEYSGWRRFVKAVSAMKELCSRSGATLVAVIFPLMSHDLRAGRYPFSHNHEVMGKVFREEGVPVIDLLEAFTAMSPARMQVIPGIDPHPSEIAHRIAAEAVFDSLLRSGLVGKDYRPRLQKERALPGIWRRTWERLHSPREHRP